MKNKRITSIKKKGGRGHHYRLYIILYLQLLIPFLFILAFVLLFSFSPIIQIFTNFDWQLARLYCMLSKYNQVYYWSCILSNLHTYSWFTLRKKICMSFSKFCILEPWEGYTNLCFYNLGISSEWVSSSCYENSRTLFGLI